MATIMMMVASVFAAMVILTVLWLVLGGDGFVHHFGTRSAGYALVSPADEPPVSPPPMAGSDSDDDHGAARHRRVELQPLLADRRFCNNETNAAILRAARTTYNGSFTCLASGLHVSHFQLDHAATVDRLQKIVDGNLPRSSVLAAPSAPGNVGCPAGRTLGDGIFVRAPRVGGEFTQHCESQSSPKLS